MANIFDKLTFIDSVKLAAQKAATALAIPVEYVVAQWAHETGYKLNSNLNLAGIYAYPTSPYGPSGKSYNSLDEFVTDYITTLQQSRYSTALKQSDAVSFAKELRLAGYAEDSEYEKANTWTEAVSLLKQYSAPILDRYNYTPTLSLPEALAAYWKAIWDGKPEEAQRIKNQYLSQKGPVQDKISTPLKKADEKVKEVLSDWSVEKVINFVKKSGVVIIGAVVVIVSFVLLINVKEG